MATKENPGKFDCYAAAKPNEPLFVLLGRDPNAPALVRAWADMREQQGEDPEKVAEARSCADAMEKHSRALGKPLVKMHVAGIVRTFGPDA
jgi:hypothetical protein